jgi:hypothetical protein
MIEVRIRVIYSEFRKRAESQLGSQAILNKSDKEIVKMLLIKD